MSNRVEWVDMVKGFAILWLIVYHFYICDWIISPVPVFFFVSGLFYSDGKSLSEFLKKKTKALLIPFCFFYVLGVVPLIITKAINGQMYDFGRLLKFFTLIPLNDSIVNPLGVGALWFLLSLFEIYILFYIIRLISKNKIWIISVSFVILVVAAVLSNYYAMGSLFYLLYSFGFLIYFAAGFLLKDVVLKEEGNSTFRFSAIFISIAALSLYFIPLNGALAFMRDRLAGMGMIVLVVVVVKMIDTVFHDKYPVIRRFLIYQGQNSLTILGTHLIAIGTFGIIMDKLCIKGLAFYLLLFIVVLLFSNLCVVIFNKYVPFMVNHNKLKSK